MTSAKATIDLNVPAEEVWQFIGGFGTIPDWLPGISECTLSEGGRIRHLGTPDGQVIVERLEAYDLAGRSYSYSILESPFPVTDYHAKLTVTATNSGNGSLVEWGASFSPDGVTEEKVQKLFDRLFTNGVQALATHYAGR
jgi:hypothetical protein